MKILITAPSLSPSKNVSGISSVVSNIIQYNKQHDFYHYLLGKPDRSMNKAVWLYHLLGQLLYFPFIIRKNKIELVHQNLPFDPKGLTREYIINFWCRIMHVPVLLHVHGGIFLMNGTNNPFFRKLAKSLFKHSKQVVVLSELEKDAISNFYQFNSVKILYNSINTASYKSGSKQLPDVKPILLFFGRIHESKGVEDIIEAFRLLKGQLNFRFVLCGAGPFKEKFITVCEQLLGDDFEYLGVVSGQTKFDIIKKSHFFLLPSRYGEGLPMALLETMAAGLVPVVTDDASMKFVVHHQINGIRVNKKDPQDLFEKLKNIMSDKKLFALMSENAIKTIKSQYDIKNYVIQLNKIYKTILVPN